MMKTDPNRPELDIQSAEQLLENVFRECGQETNNVPMEALSAYTTYRSERFRIQRGVLAALMLLFLLLPFLFIQPSFTVMAEQDGERKLPVYTVKVDSLLPVYSVTAVQKNRKLPVYEEDGRTYTIEPTRNGRLDISVSLFNRQSEEQSIEVDGVDRNGPVYTESKVTEDGKVWIFVRDEGIGVDLEGAYAENASGKIIKPCGTDHDEGAVIFTYPTETWDVYVPDLLGNTLHMRMRIG